jgi:hypothetical protein
MEKLIEVFAILLFLAWLIDGGVLLILVTALLWGAQPTSQGVWVMAGMAVAFALGCLVGLVARLSD